jgi:hypothetical protein
MAELLTPDVGLVELVNELRAEWGNSLQIGLYVAAHTPIRTDDLVTYQAIEASYPGYARQFVQAWGPAIIDGAGRAGTRADFVTWDNPAGGAPEWVYGYFVLTQTGKLLWAEPDPHAPRPIAPGPR